MKINKWIRGGKALAGSIACCLALAGCLREEFSEAGSEVSPEEGRTYGLGFSIAATSLGDNGMRYGNDLENYINPAQFRILFLDEDGNFRFEFSQYKYDEIDQEKNIITDPKQKKLKGGLRLEPLYQTNGSAVSQWFVRIPTDDLSDEDLKLITDNKFKIAVMANWPDETFKGEGSNINTNFLIPGTEQQIANRLAHCHNDEPYTRDKNADYGIYKSYEPFLGPDNDEALNQMSVSMDWVKDHYAYVDGTQLASDEEKYDMAEDDIRNGFNPSRDGEYRPYIDGRSGRRYFNMWYIWNFGGKNNDPEVKFENSDKEKEGHSYYNGKTKEWVDRNENYGWASYFSSNNTAILSKTGNYDGVIFASNGSADFKLTEEPPYGFGVEMPCLGGNKSSADNQAIRNKHMSGEQDVFAFLDNDPKEGTTDDAKTNPLYGYFKIPLAADGMLRIKLGAKCGDDINDVNHRVSLGIHYGARAADVAKNQERRETFDIITNGAQGESYAVEYDYEVKITERVQDAYLYALCDNPNDRLIIYEIEYIKNIHLADVERDGIQVSKEQPIPMYGIQDFDPIGAYWTPGELFNLSSYSGSHSGNYNYKWISLLRSVAKVELKIAKAPFKEEPQYIYMRSMNRTARLNPIDVMTPTNQIWYGDGNNNIAGIKQETQNIQEYGPMFENIKRNDDDAMAYFHNRLAWFFGIWRHPSVGISDPKDPSKKWNWNGKNLTYSGLSSPRVFNPHINRSDYTHFHKEGEDDSYWYYTLYMPEKHMTDPNKPGDMAEAPKCLRIEMRWEGVNDDSNLDDNASYRIYFADPLKGGKPFGSYNRDNYENVDGAYENDLENLKTFWPIVRNHVYEVTVSGINQGDIQFEVRGAATRDVDITFN